MSRPAGIPLLSGPAPTHPGPEQKACRKCGKEFNIFFHRQRKCMHCGFGYCSSCTDYQALMPRSHGYDLAPVCGYCIELLNVTALGRAQLRSLPLAKLRRYIVAYNIPVKNAIDKNDLVDAAVLARTPQGCLSPTNEDYYRKHSVPSFTPPGHSSTPPTNRSSSARTNTNTHSRPNASFPRPDLDPNRPQRPQETAYSIHSTRSRTASAPATPRTTRPSAEPNISRPTSSTGRPSTPITTGATHPSSAPPPPPMSTLVTLPRSSVSAFAVGTLKQILFEARVRVPPGVVEKEELVERVWALVEEEKRKDDEGIDNIGSAMDEDEIESIEGPDREEEVVVEMVDPESAVHMNAAHEHGQGNDRHAASVGAGHDHMSGHHSASATNVKFPPTSPKPSTSSSPPKPGPRSHLKPTSAERSGLCVICQDEEANIAVVDCGHLAMCRECSDLVLASSRECPLCRTRIVTEARLLRIFKT